MDNVHRIDYLEPVHNLQCNNNALACLCDVCVSRTQECREPSCTQCKRERESREGLAQEVVLSIGNECSRAD